MAKSDKDDYGRDDTGWESRRENTTNEKRVRSSNESMVQQTDRKSRNQAAAVRRSGNSSAAAREEGLAEAKTALEGALDNKCLDPVLLDVHDLCSYTSYILVVSGRSDRHVESMCEGIKKTMREHGHYPLGTEGTKSGQWALLDFGDCVVHVFYHATREHYDLEGLWIDAPRVPIDVPAEARSTSADLE
jgi:ribosome-associated protein